MDVLTDINPVELTRYVRPFIEAVDEDRANGTLADILPAEKYDSDSVEWTTESRTGVVAQVRSWDTESAIASGGYAARNNIAKLPPISIKDKFGELAKIRRMGRNAPETVQVAAERIAKDVAFGVLDRVIQFRGEALETGKLVIREGGVIQDVDFGRKAEFTKTAGTLFSAPGADPIAFLETLLEDFEKENGELPDRLVGSKRVRNALRKAVVAAGYFGADKSTFVRNSDVDELLTDRDIPAFTTNDKVIGGKRVVGADKLILAKSVTAGQTAWGTPAEVADPKYSAFGPGEASGVLVGSYDEQDPWVTWIRSTAVALAVLTNPNATMAAKVL